MCFSATSSFIAAAAIGSIGIATLRHVREPRALLFASVPMLFAVHQFTEGWVWLGLEGRIGKLALDHVGFLFLLYAQGILPLLMPAAVALLEPPGWRRQAILALTVAGALVGAWNIYGLVAFPSEIRVVRQSIAYHNLLTGNFWTSCLYVVVTCGALLLSTHRVVRIYGLINVVVLTIAEIVRAYAFASVWCFYAAIMSAIIYWQFRRANIDIETPNGASLILRRHLLPWLHPARRVVRDRSETPVEG
jgi:hypothetical protein